MHGLFEVPKRKLSTFASLKNTFLAFWNYITAYGKSVQNGYRTNAFAPIKWLTIFLCPLLMAGILLIKILFVQILLVALLVGVVMFALLMYFLIFKEDPKLLQSEAFRIEDRKLDLISQKGGDISINAVELTTSTNILGDSKNE